MTCGVCLRPNTGNAVSQMWSLCVECVAVHLHSNRRETLDVEEAPDSPPGLTVTLNIKQRTPLMLSALRPSLAHIIKAIKGALTASFAE